MKCSACGFESEGSFCTNCGAALSQNEAQPVQPAPVQPTPAASYPQNSVYPNAAVNRSAIPIEYKPISAWGYFGYQLLFAIPLVGFIMLLVFACGGTSNVNLKNYARSYFCGLIIVVALIVGFIVLNLILGGALLAISSNY